MPKLTPVNKPSRPVSTAGSDKVEDSAAASVRANLQSVLSTIKQLATRLDGWSPDTGTFSDGGELKHHLSDSDLEDSFSLPFLRWLGLT